MKESGIWDRRSGIFFIAVIFILFFPDPAFAQNAPITTAANITGAVPGLVQVQVTVVNFTSIGAISLTIDYNYSVMHFTGSTPNPLLSSFTALDNDLGNGTHRIIMGWFGSAKTLPDGSTIITLKFTFIAGSTSLEWYDDGTSCEYADGNYNVLNDIPQSTYYINGYVCGVIPDPGTVSGDSSVCEGEAGVYYSVAPIPGVTGYAWTVPPGAIITGGGDTYWILAEYPSGSSSGNVTVAGINLCGTGPASQLAVTVNPLPIADAGNDTTIPYGTSTYLHAADGGTGVFSYHWSPENLLVDPDVQDPLTMQLTATNVFTLLVTNLITGCWKTDNVIVYVSGGSLNVNPVAIPDSICRGSDSQLYANAGGGSGNYSYQWVCVPPGSPPWVSTEANPLVSPDTTTLYLLTVYDGFGLVNGSVIVNVTPIPGTPWILDNGGELSSDTCCGNQWYMDGVPIPGATGQTYTTNHSGLYFDIVTIHDCSSDTSNFLYVVMTGEEGWDRDPPILVYPNPASDRIFVRLSGLSTGNTIVEIYSLAGVSLQQVFIHPGNSVNDVPVDVSRLPGGFYILHIWNSSQSFYQRIVVD